MTLGIPLLIALSLPSHSAGQTDPPLEAPSVTARLDVRAAPGCTSRGDVAARVASRSPRIRFVDGDARLEVKVSFTDAPSGGVQGELVVAGSGGKALSRRFIARSCVEAADTVAIIVAVTLDPTAATGGNTSVPDQAKGEPPAPAADATNPTPSPAVDMVTETAVSPSERKIATTEQPALAAEPHHNDSSATHPPIPRQHRAVIHLEGRTLFGPAPAVMPGIGMDVTLLLQRRSVWSPAFTVGAIHAWRSGLSESGGTATFSLNAATMDACAIRLRLSIVESRACISGLFGGLSSRGSDTIRPASVLRPFATAGAALVFVADLGSLLELSTRVGAGVTLVRDWYLFTPTVFHRADPVTFDLGVGLGLRLP